VVRSGVPVALAVSGGCDSMVLMWAIHRAATGGRGGQGEGAGTIEVVTFDHGTGAAATAAAALVVREATRLGLRVRSGRADGLATTEAEWRAARWAFIRSVVPPDHRVATAHTQDDQLETVVIRAMRGAGARGLAALAVPADGVIRPFLHLSRAALRRYADVRGVPFVDDPSNLSRTHLRNRVRLDLLPAIRRLRPEFGAEMLAVADRAARLRAEVDALALRFVSNGPVASTFRVAREELATYDSRALCALWPAIAARAGVTLDRRGTLRLAQFTTSGTPGSRIQLSGGIEVLRQRDASGDAFMIQAVRASERVTAEVPLVGVVELGRWRFRPAPGPRETTDRDICVPQAWMADLPGDGRLSVREWRAGDRMRAGVGGAARRVKRFFGDARVPGASRAGWPVVLWDDEIVWIPGVRRVGAAPERSGRPVVRYICERSDGRPAYS
jgi:tRNA(Ile)-lysidine synthase